MGWSGIGNVGDPDVYEGGTRSCQNGSFVTVSQNRQTIIQVRIRCRICTNSDCLNRTSWLLGLSFSSAKGGVYYGGVMTPVPVQSRIFVASCSPLVFSQKKITFVCEPSAPPDPRSWYDCCGAGTGDVYLSHTGQCTDQGLTTLNSTLGCQITIDISE